MTFARTALALVVATAVWLPSVHAFYAPDARDRDRTMQAIAAREERAWNEPRRAETPARARAEMRAVNPEWDFMSRTFTALGLANLALAKDTPPARRDELARAIDAVVDDTIATDREEGRDHFLLPYGRGRSFVDPETHSVFIDGELLMMIAARDLVAPRDATRAEARTLATRIAATMARSPSLSAESYPDDCWTFCNTTALAALAMNDRADGVEPDDPAGGDHAALARAWVANAKAHLVDPKTGLLVSRYTYAGEAIEGPEGSSIWMTATNLLVIDPAFGRDQYDRARRELRGSFLGFGWAREWPDSSPKRPDVDSGAIVPWLDASAGSSGFAVLASRAVGDDAYATELLSSLELAGFPDAAHSRFRAGNEVGDAVLLYALAYGPLAEKVAGAGARRAAEASR